jgi:hypothetical protein
MDQVRDDDPRQECPLNGHHGGGCIGLELAEVFTACGWAGTDNRDASFL